MRLVNAVLGHTALAGDLDVFVSKLTPQGDALTYSTYLGGSTNDYGNAIALDPSGAAYIGGTTTSPDYDTLNPIQGNQGSNDAYVTKLTPSGALSYSTYLGGSIDEAGNAIAADSGGSAYVTGLTVSSDFPTANPMSSDLP